MGFLDKVSKELKKAAQEGWEAVKDGAKVAAEKGEEVAKVGKLRYRSHSIHKSAEKYFTELGGVIYELAKPPFDNPLLDSDVKALIKKIKTIEDEADTVDEKIKSARKKASTKKTAVKKKTVKKAPAKKALAKKTAKVKKKEG